MSHGHLCCQPSVLTVEQGSKVELLQEGDLRHRERVEHDIQSPNHGQKDSEGHK